MEGKTRTIRGETLPKVQEAQETANCRGSEQDERRDGDSGKESPRDKDAAVD